MSSGESVNVWNFDGFELAEEDQHQLVLNIVRQEMMEQSEREADIIDLGTLSGGINEHLWGGAISLAKRIESGEISQDQVDEALGRVNKTFVPVAFGAPKRCVDGSTIEGYDDNDPQWYARGLGPQIQGGTADEAFAMRLVMGVAEDEPASLLSDIRSFVSQHTSDFTPGDHIDNHATDQNCGCGAIACIHKKTAMATDETAIGYAHDRLGAIYATIGAEEPEGVFEQIKHTELALQAQGGYVPENTMEVIDLIRELNPKPEAVERLVRPHNEIGVVINFVENTTFHRDHYNAQTDSKLQMFNLDAWVILKEHGPEAGYALLLDAVQTLMQLTDGTGRLLLRLPKSEPTDIAA